MTRPAGDLGRLPLVMLVVLLAAPAAWAVDRAAAWRAGSSSGVQAATIGDDSAGVPMFSVDHLAPGQTVDRCVHITYTGPVHGDISLQIQADAGALAPYLEVEVSTGTGGSFASGCGDFVASKSVYRGTLAELLRSRPDGLSAFTATAHTPTRAVRFAFTLSSDNAAQGRSTALNVVWLANATEPHGPAVPARAPVAVPPGTRSSKTTPTATSTAPQPSPSAAGAGASPARFSKDLQAPSGAVPRRGRHVATAAAGVGARRARSVGLGHVRAAGPRALGSVTAPSTPAGGRAGRRSAPIAVQVARRCVLPLLLIVTMVLFLLVQDQIDRRDPKLALARLRAEIDLLFTDRKTTTDEAS